MVCGAPTGGFHRFGYHGGDQVFDAVPGPLIQS